MAQWILGASRAQQYKLLPSEIPEAARTIAPLEKTKESQAPTQQHFQEVQEDLGDPEKDIVQFFSRVFYASEGDHGTVQVKLMRIGSLEGTCSVRCKTVDGSSKAGVKYLYKEAVVAFGHGECLKTFDVHLMNDDSFDTTLDFEVEMARPKNCGLQPDFRNCTVMIYDDDLFPSNRFKPEVVMSEEELHKVGFSLLFAFIRFAFTHVPTIWWKSTLMLLLAQLGNAYYLMTIYLKVYLVDVCLNIKDESTADHLFVPGSRRLTAILLGLAYVLPNFILLASDLFEMSILEMGYHIRQHLRVNLFRKYLNYTPGSRAEVPIQDLKTSMMEDIPNLVKNGYVIVFELMKKVGKVLCVAIFLLKRHPKAGVPLLIYPLLMILVLGARYKKRLSLLKKTGDGESQTQGWLIHADQAFELVQDYQNRSAIVTKFTKVLQNQRQLVMALKSFSFWNGVLVPWITIVATGCYIGLAGHLVTEGILSLGSFLATINLYKDLGDRFEGIYNDFEALSEVIDPLSVLTRQFNLATDLPQRMEVHDASTEYVTNALASEFKSTEESIYDGYPIKMDQIQLSAAFSPRDGPAKVGALQDIQIPQGCVLYVFGPHSSGKARFLSYLAHRRMPGTGRVLSPPHLRAVNIGHTPLFIKTVSLTENLKFGINDSYPATFENPLCTPDRIRRILKRLGLESSWVWEEFNQEVELQEVAPAPRQGEDDDVDMDPEGEGDAEGMDPEADDAETWDHKISHSERKRLHLARGLICNPEILILHKPVDEMDEDLKKIILDLLREFVDERGVEMDPATKNRRRPRTVIFSGKAGMSYDIVDYICRLEPDGQATFDKGMAGASQSRSWFSCQLPV